MVTVTRSFDKNMRKHGIPEPLRYLEIAGVKVIEEDFETLKEAAAFIKMPLDEFLAMKLSFVARELSPGLEKAKA